MGHIIVPLDGSERAELILPHALALAKGLDGKLWLVRVTPGDNMTQSERDELDMLAHQIQDEGVPMLRGRCFTETFPGPL
ncbi:MAG TPA: universal stress protein [Dehalococcoidia bacterium]|nr:universal stress protein [Dehalococcoidia bacterium]